MTSGMPSDTCETDSIPRHRAHRHPALAGTARRRNTLTAAEGLPVDHDEHNQRRSRMTITRNPLHGSQRAGLPHHRRASVDFPTRPAGPSPTGDQGLSRFSREVCPGMLGVSDRAGLHRVWPYRRAGCGLPPSSTASASRSEVLSRLNTRPARSPVNASPPPLRAHTPDSGPVWVATPSPCDSFIHYTSPV